VHWRRLASASQRIARLDARLLLEQVCVVAVNLIAHPERHLLAAERRSSMSGRASRAGEPLAYLVGSAFFYGLELRLAAY